MQFFCCAKPYSFGNIDTYKYLRLFKNNPTKKNLSEIEIFFEMTVLLTCIKNDCNVCFVFRFDEDKELIKTCRYCGKNAKEHMRKIKDSCELVKIPGPIFLPAKGTNNINIHYWDGKSNRQREYNINGNSTGRKIKPELKIENLIAS